MSGAVTQAAARLPDFAPGWPLRNPHLQSTLASMSPRRLLWRLHDRSMEDAAHPHLLECGGGDRLLGFHSPQPAGHAPRGLVVLIHGWEGCHDSVYLYSMACHLYAAGYNVFRLDLRDHGGTHALNREPFHSARMSDVLGGIRAILCLDATRPLFCVGFSLGGSFALRIALQGAAQGLRPELAIGISPAINPAATLNAIDHGNPLYLRYFLKKWRKTLENKNNAWPEHFDFSAAFRFGTLTEATRHFAETLTEHRDLRRYLDAYTLTPAMLKDAPVPVAVITAQDDPVIPFADFAGLRAIGSVAAFLAPRHGGHCGYIANWRLQSWAERAVTALLDAACAGENR
ncbi:MAG: alpha/beta fold hydrolase [Gammaproteobacteria bacterium]|nr:alpha/beta fold hydrolase [Gammaproteobacteria bacterium]